MHIYVYKENKNILEGTQQTIQQSLLLEVELGVWVTITYYYVNSVFIINIFHYTAIYIVLIFA